MLSNRFLQLQILFSQVGLSIEGTHRIEIRKGAINVKVIVGFPMIRIIVLGLLACILPGESIPAVNMENQDSPQAQTQTDTAAQPGSQTQPDAQTQADAQAQAESAKAQADAQAQAESAKAQADAQAQAKADAAIQQIRTACNVSDTETDPKKMDKQSDCVARAVAAMRRKIMTQNALSSTVTRAYGAPGIPGGAQPSGRTPAPAPPAPPPASTTSQPPYVGASASGTPSTCGPGTGVNNPLIRVHRMLMAPKNASDDFGYRLGRRFFIYQVTIENQSTDHQFLVHDVSIDLSTLFFAQPGTYLYTASSQDLTLLRGIPEKGQDLDKRNLTLHVLQGVGSVAGAVSGLTSFSDVMGPSVAVFNGPFIQALVGIAPDHTATQLNRLSDSAYITNTLIDKQRAKSIAMFIPEATLLSKRQQNTYWNEPHTFLEQVLNLDQADVCIDGAFITTVAAPPTLTSANLTPKTAGTKLGPGVQAILRIQGTNLLVGDTQVIGLGPALALTTASGITGSVDLTLPSDYKTGAQVHLVSAANPTYVSAAVATTALPSAAPTLTSATLTSKTQGTTLGAGVQATLAIQGTNLVLGDTQVIGLGPTVTLTSATGTAGSIELALPADYKSGMQIHLASAADPTLVSAPITISTATPIAPTLTKAVLGPKVAGTKLGAGVQATLAVQGTNLVLGDTQVVGLGPTTKLTTATGTAGSIELALPADYKSGMQIHLASAADPTLVSAPITISTATPIAPTLTKAVLGPKVAGTKLGAGVQATLAVQGTNLVLGDTQIVGLGPTVVLSTVKGATGSVDLTLPPNYKAGMQVHLASAANPKLTSATVLITSTP
jgi:hypothetical protein